MCPVVKQKEERKKLPAKYLLLIFTVICMGLMVFTFTRDIPVTVAEDAAGAVIVPFQKGITRAGSAIVAFVTERHNIEELKAENRRLQDEIDELGRKNAQLLQDGYELAELRELYELDNSYSEYEKTGATIIAASAGNRFNSFIIDKGREDGIEKDMNVIAGTGLVGIVSEVGKNWARVNTIISNGTNVSAAILHNQDNLIVSGDMELMQQGRIRYSQLSGKEQNVHPGDKIVTSNISDKYLPGILIGYISTVDTDSNQLTYSGQLTPVVDFEHLSYVLIIKQKKAELED
ncbi:MAG: rod shape-determining protein MreC [Lachnospiraceae bacterium]|nr:rod shape-determining protein MreC [Lachnospiraceae bacterium]